MNLILLGPPGAGKGTQAALITEKYGVPHISTGDIFRENISKGTDLGKRISAFMNTGKLVPDDLVIDTALARLSEDDFKEGFLLDGFPRTVHQAEELDRFLAENQKKIDCVINIDVDKDELMDRIMGRRVCKDCGASYHVTFKPSKDEGVCDECGGELYQRADDNEATVAQRIETYETQTMPLITYYTDAGVIANIDGAAEMEKVFEDIALALGA